MSLPVRCLLVIILFWVLIVGVMFVMQRALLYHPDGRIVGDPQKIGADAFRPVTVRTEDALPLTFWHAPPRAPGMPTVVLFHGNAGNHADRLATALAFVRAGYGFVLASYRGYGGNPGAPTEQGLYADARAILRWVRGTTSAPLILYGESLGSGVASQMATEFPVGAMILEAPFTSVADAAQEIYPFLPARLLTRDRFETLARISVSGAPVLVIHGERDPIIPVHHGRAVLAAAPAGSRGIFLPAAGHQPFSPDLMPEIVAFIATAAEPASPHAAGQQTTPAAVAP